MSALDVQVGGNHYKKYKIQPMEYSMANGLDACQHTAIKYVTRFRDKGGIADLEKAKHCIDLLIEFERKALGDLAVSLVSDDLMSGGKVAEAMGDSGLPDGWTAMNAPRLPFAAGTLLELRSNSGPLPCAIAYEPGMTFEGVIGWRFAPAYDGHD